VVREGARNNGFGMSGRIRVAVLISAAVLTVVVAFRVLSREDNSGPHEISGLTMGTFFSVTIDESDISSSELPRLRDSIQNRLDRIESLMSTYDANSELSRFNGHQSLVPFEVSQETLEVFSIARSVSERSDGAFDVTVKPLVDAWGFGPPDQPPEPPADSVLAVLAQRVGYGLIAVDSASGTLTKSDPLTVADLSAVAKGYGVDQVSEALETLGLRNFLVEVGGEVKARGRKRDGSSWTVGIERPDSDRRTAFEVLKLDDAAVATSGDYRNYYELDGIRYSHIIDPRTHAPVRHLGASVTVLHRQAAFADAWATALSVLGPEEGMDVAEREAVAAVFLVRSGGGFVVRRTSEYRRLVGLGVEE